MPNRLLVVGLALALLARPCPVGAAVARVFPYAFNTRLALSDRPREFRFSLVDEGGATVWSEVKAYTLRTSAVLRHTVGSVDPARNPLPLEAFAQQLRVRLEWRFQPTPPDDPRWRPLALTALRAVPYALWSAGGEPGPVGPAGDTGASGRACWDLDGGGLCERAFEDVNHDGVCDALDCRGVPGDAGPQGDSGPVGATGPEGATGATGSAGATGLQGPTGAPGATGPLGPAGPSGATGAQGATGPQGLVGATGALGPPGPEGATGATGVPGSPGNPALDCEVGQTLLWTASGWGCITVGAPTSCTPGALEPCYTGPEGTLGVGACRAGFRTCLADGVSWGACAQQVLPAALDRCVPAGAADAAPYDATCDGVNATADTADCVTRYADADLDGFGATADARCVCPPGSGVHTAAEGGDPDDANCLANPDLRWFLNARSGAYPEWCTNGVDDNGAGGEADCAIHYDSTVYESGNPVAVSGWFDRDGDGFFTTATETLPVWFGACAAGALTPSAPAPALRGDCDNLDPAVHPGAPDLCDGIDQDCGGFDGVAEVCANGLDEDCDGVVDEATCSP